MSHHPQVYITLALMLLLSGVVAGMGVMLGTGVLIVVLFEVFYRYGVRRILFKRFPGQDLTKPGV